MASYKNPSLTVDTFIFNDKCEFALIKRLYHPFKDYWALPGGFVEYGETVEEAAIRESKEETGIDVNLLDIVNVYSDPNRDPRGHTVTVAFLANGDLSIKNADSDAKDIEIFCEDDLDKLEIAFDHRKIIKDCLKKAKKSI
nr:NUDIX hydrolase [uncultured Methanobrevibacter sp.]